MSPEAMRIAVAEAKGDFVRSAGFTNADIISCGAIHDLPDYPGDIAAAWGLLMESGWGYVMGGDPKCCSITVYPDGKGITATAGTAQLAICEAYLKAKGLWKEGE